MRRIYRVKYRAQYLTKGHKRPHWNDGLDPLDVLANGDAREAIRKAERHVLRHNIVWVNDDSRKIVEIPKVFKLDSVEILAEADI